MVRGCLFNGSATMTLSWDPTALAEPPAIRRGTWLMEATLSPGLRDTTTGPAARGGPAPLPENSFLMAAAPPATPASGYVKYRHAIEFYRVASVEAAVPSQTGDAQAGFTLVEMLVAMALVLFILGLFAILMQSAMQGVRDAKGINAIDQKLRNAVTLLKADLRQVYLANGGTRFSPSELFTRRDRI